MTRVPLTGGAYQAHSVIASAQRCVNLYSEPMPSASTEPQPVALYPTPGLRLLGTMPQAGIRGGWQATNGNVYVVAGNGVYSVGADWSGSSLGSITAGKHTPVSMIDNGLELVIVDGSANGWHVTLASNTFGQITDPTGSFRGGDRVDYVDTFFLFNVPGTPQFQSSDSLSLTFDPLFFANKEAFSDLLQTLVVAKRQIWLLGTKTTEIFFNAGAADFPFQSFPNVLIDRGCAAKYSAAEIDDAVYWLAQDRRGQGIVMQGAGYEATRISTFAIEQEFATYTRIDDAIGFTYLLAGHLFYVLTFPHADKTWSYDIATKLWHEWLWIDSNGTEHRHRANCMFTARGLVIAGDWQNGNLYAVDPAVYTDNGGPIKRLRAYPHMLADGKRVFYRQFLADIEAGNLPAPSTQVVPGTVSGTLSIAQLVVPSDAIGAPSRATADWTRGAVYLINNAGIRRYSTAVATQSPAASAAWPVTTVLGADVDPTSGKIIAQLGAQNGDPVRVFDATTLAQTASYGSGTGLPTYPSDISSADKLVCVGVGTTASGGATRIGYALLLGNFTPGAVQVMRLDTIGPAGFSAGVVSGAVGNRALMCRGATSATLGSVFLTWDGAFNGQTANIPLYTVRITQGAETYNIASWPTTNPHIAASTIGTIAAAAVDAAWTTLKANTLGYDQTDGNVLLDVTGNVGPNIRYIAKVNAATAAVIWAVPIGTTAAALEGYNVSRSYVGLLPSGARDVLTTAGGSLATAAMAGVTPSLVIGDDHGTILVAHTDYTEGTTSPAPVSGTPTSFTSGWAIIAGVYPQLTATEVVADPHQVFLSWSDDRGHSFGNPVSASLGGGGEYLTSLQWQRLGMARDRVFQIEWSTPVATALQGAWVSTDVAGS